MSRELGNFDSIASIYDILVKIVFGKSVRRAQLYFLNEIPERCNILILGGGTGWFLAELVKVRPLCKVWYVEASLKMIDITKKKAHGWPSVIFIHGTEASIPVEVKFDAVITNFYLDLFTIPYLNEVICKIQGSFASNGLWLVTDFVDGGKIWQKVLLKWMYTFFRLVCKIEARSLPAWRDNLQQVDLIQIRSKYFYRGFIQSSMYRYYKRIEF